MGLLDKLRRKSAGAHKNPDAEEHFSLGVACHNRGLLDRAIVEYERAIESNPNNPMAHHNLACVYRRKWEQAVVSKLSARAIGADPNKVAALVPDSDLEKSYNVKYWVEKAIEECTQAIRLEPNHAKTHAILGDAYMRISALENAIREYKRAVALDPACTTTSLAETSFAHFNLAQAYFQARVFNRAWKHVRIAEKLGEDKERIAELVGDLQKAVREPKKKGACAHAPEESAMLGDRWANRRLKKAAKAVMKTQNDLTIKKLLKLRKSLRQDKKPEQDPLTELHAALSFAILVQPNANFPDQCYKRAEAAYAIAPEFSHKVPIWLLTDEHPLDPTSHAMIDGDPRGHIPWLARLLFLSSRENKAPERLRQAASHVTSKTSGNVAVSNLAELLNTSGLLTPAETKLVCDFAK